MKRIGLTGGIATGKSTVANMCVDAGAGLIAADTIVHALYASDAKLRAKIEQMFGATVLTANGGIDRVQLGALVFSNPTARRRLESVVHPLVRQRIAAETQRHEALHTAICLYDIPLLFESGYAWQFDAVIVAVCDPETQIARVMQRYHCSREIALQRIGAQMPLDEKMARADYVIRTDGPLAATRQQLDQILHAIAARPDGSGHTNSTTP